MLRCRSCTLVVMEKLWEHQHSPPRQLAHQPGVLPLSIPQGHTELCWAARWLASPSPSPATHPHLDQHWVCSRLLVTTLWQNKERQRDKGENYKGGKRWKEYVCGVENAWIDHWLWFSVLFEEAFSRKYSTGRQTDDRSCKGPFKWTDFKSRAD